MLLSAPDLRGKLAGDRDSPPRRVSRGTRLELTMCWPDAPVTDKGEQLRSHLTQALRQTASAYQAAIEPGS
jgi:hypothetical protein